MINYHRSAFGWNLLFRFHGSAVYRACLPGFIAVLFFILISLTPLESTDDGAEETLMHPYVVGVVVGGITFLIVFRASSSYSRYWEATSAVYGMQSKWMDATISTAGYHMQCSHYKKIKPPTYYDYPNLNSQFLTRDRERMRLNSIRFHNPKGVMNEKRAQLRSINAQVVESDDDLDDPDGTGMKKYNPHDKSNLMTHQRRGTLIKSMFTTTTNIPSGSGHGSSASSGGTGGDGTGGDGTGTGTGESSSPTSPSSSSRNQSSKGHRRMGSGGGRRKTNILQQPSNLFETASAVQERRTRTGHVSFAVRGGTNNSNANASSSSNSPDSNIKGGRVGGEQQGGVGVGGGGGLVWDGGKETAADITSFESSSNNKTNNAMMKEQRHVDFVDLNDIDNDNDDDNAASTGRSTSSSSRRTTRTSGGRGTGRFSLNRDQAVYQPHFLSGPSRVDGNWGPLFDDGKNTFVDPNNPNTTKLPDTGFASCQGGRTPPLFLQELAHLSSLLTAVAFSTLRNDIDGAESPLDFYHIGSPWPEVDPKDIDLGEDLWDSIKKHIKYFFGSGRTPEERTKINAARPLSVLGGVSDAEIKFLQMARGPFAKTQLCWSWLSEFITREHLEGTLGEVGAPIISRVVQFLGDGMREYNHARKIMFIPFPFPHAQLSALYVLVMIPMLPYLMQQYCSTIWVGAILSFLSVTCLSAIHEVARELENPFRNIPNELPVCTFMAEFNETLLTMYSGFHPDFFWEVPEEFINDSLRSGGGATTTSGGGGGGGASSSAESAAQQLTDFNDSARSMESFGNDENDFLQQHSGTAFAAALSSSYSDENKFENSNSSILNTVVEEDEEGEISQEIIFSDTAPTDDESNASRGRDIQKKNLSPSDNSSNNDADVAVESQAGTEATASTTGTASTTDTTTHENNNSTSTSTSTSDEVGQLRAIVQQQGKMMATMLEEQARLNQMIENLLSKEQNQQSKKER